MVAPSASTLSRFAGWAIDLVGRYQEAGITHLIEHMLFKGTEKRTAKQIAESILRTAKGGERDMTILQRIALMELQLTGRA